MTKFLDQIMTAIDNNLKDYRKARSAFAHEYAVTRSQGLGFEKAVQCASSVAFDYDNSLGADELARWATRCERAYLANFNNSILDESPTVAVIKCLD